MTVLSVILHIDLDCFYAQVERERLGLGIDAALAVLQWNSALAVSYPARKYNIKRGATAEDIRKLSGDAVRIVHVETRGSVDAQGTQPVQNSADGVQQTQKVSLARYRNASADVFAAMADVLSNYRAVFERASIDEAYVDVTAQVDRRLRQSDCDLDATVSDTVVVGDKIDFSNETDRRLAVGASIASELRAAIMQKCRYTSSAGISVNKMLAKFASARNKPNKQTILPVYAVEELMLDVPLRKLRGLGGKLGKDVEALGVSTAGEASRLSMGALEKKLGKRKLAEFVYNSVRGLDDSEVREREKTKSLLAAKSFSSQNCLETIETHWIPLLAEELAERIAEDEQMHARDAKTLSISFRSKLKGNDTKMQTGSRSVPMPSFGQHGRTPAIVKAAIDVVRHVMLEECIFTFPINFVGLTATNFQDRARGNENISRYFSKVAKRERGAEAGAAAVETIAVKQVEKSSGKRRLHTSTIDGFLKEAAGRNEAATMGACSAEQLHQKRLQESADREMALRLHREESVRLAKGKRHSNDLINRSVFKKKRD